MDDNRDRIEIETDHVAKTETKTTVAVGTEVALEKDEDFSSDATAEIEVPIAGEEDELRARIAELEDRLLRSAAEFDNYRKRSMRQNEELVKAGNDRILADILDVADNFERALKHTASENDPESFRKGIELIYSQTLGLLGRYDVTPIDALGQPFDPSLHEAVIQVDSDEYGEGVVALDLTKGYKQGARVIRHSKVGVSRGCKGPDTNENK